MFGKFNIGIIGTGNIAGVMANTVNQMKNVKLYGAASREKVKADVFAGKYGCKKAYGSYEELAADKKVDLIYIATPHSEHYANARMCLEYGKPVLCEKSFTANASQAEELIAEGSVGGGMLPKLGNCTSAVRNGVNRVHILDGRIPHCLLLEIFTRQGIGTAILDDSEME